MAPAHLPSRWRERADDLTRYGAVQAAETHRALAVELEDALREQADEELTLGEASAASGYSERRLRELLADGTVPQAGRKGAPRIRRGDLPQRMRARGNGYDAAADAAQLLGQMQHRPPLRAAGTRRG